jgi:CxxC motif-containing protein (DUF1111 family)
MDFKITARPLVAVRFQPTSRALSGPIGLAVAGLLAAACSGAPPIETPTLVSEDPTDMPLKLASTELVDRFNSGDALFDLVYLEADGLGPNYIRNACASCHEGAGKGPGNVQKMVVVEADGQTPAPDQSILAYGHTARPYYAGGAQTPLVPPADTSRIKLSLRIGPAVFGRGYLEAIEDAEIERVEAEQALRSDGISGRINRVSFTSEPNPDQRFHHYVTGQTGLIGRFGLKARVATLDDFAADAAQGDMSMTSPMRPKELPNPDARTDDLKTGADLDIEVINELADYMRLLEIPRRAAPAANGPALFEATLCAACHVPSMKTRANYPLAPLAGISAPVFTDLLLHDLGEAMADGQTDGSAMAREWRTAPLIGLRHFRNFLHDGRAKTIEEAILLHDGAGSEAHVAVEKFRSLSEADRAALLTYVSSL